MAGPLGWDDAVQRDEVERYRLRVAAERDSQTRLDDRSADAVRMGAPEPRRLVSLSAQAVRRAAPAGPAAGPPERSEPVES